MRGRPGLDPSEQQRAEHDADIGGGTGDADQRGRRHAGRFDHRAELHDDRVEEQADAEGDGDKATYTPQHRWVGQSRPCLGYLVGFKQDDGGGGSHRQRQQIHPERPARAEDFAQRAAHGNQRDGADAGGRDLDRDPAFAPFAFEIITDHGGGDGHDHRFRQSQRDAHGEDGIEAVEQEREQAKARIGEQRADQQAFAPGPIGQPTRERRE